MVQNGQFGRNLRHFQTSFKLVWKCLRFSPKCKMAIFDPFYDGQNGQIRSFWPRLPRIGLTLYRRGRIKQSKAKNRLQAISNQIGRNFAFGEIWPHLGDLVPAKFASPNRSNKGQNGQFWSNWPFLRGRGLRPLTRQIFDKGSKMAQFLGHFWPKLRPAGLCGVFWQNTPKWTLLTKTSTRRPWPPKLCKMTQNGPFWPRLRPAGLSRPKCPIFGTLVWTGPWAEVWPKMFQNGAFWPQTSEARPVLTKWPIKWASLARTGLVGLKNGQMSHFT